MRSVMPGKLKIKKKKKIQQCLWASEFPNHN